MKIESFSTNIINKNDCRLLYFPSPQSSCCRKAMLFLKAHSSHLQYVIHNEFFHLLLLFQIYCYTYYYFLANLLLY